MRILISALLLASLTGCATMNEPSSSRTATKLSPAERAKKADELFKLFDTNKDGFLSKEELSAGMSKSAMNYRPNPNLMMGMTETKKKKSARTLTKEEVAQTVEEAFASRDQDLDRRLSQEEFKRVVVGGADLNPEDDPWAPFM